MFIFFLTKQEEQIKVTKDTNIHETPIKIILIFRNSKNLQSYGSGVTLIVESGRGNLIWRILSFVACKAIGLNEYSAIL